MKELDKLSESDAVFIFGYRSFKPIVYYFRVILVFSERLSEHLSDITSFLHDVACSWLSVVNTIYFLSANGLSVLIYFVVYNSVSISVNDVIMFVLRVFS